MSILATKNLCKTYGQGDNSVNALNKVSVNIEDGEFVAIIGTSGSGKSTLLNMLGVLTDLLRVKYSFPEKTYLK